MAKPIALIYINALLARLGLMLPHHRTLDLRRILSKQLYTLRAFAPPSAPLVSRRRFRSLWRVVIHKDGLPPFLRVVELAGKNRPPEHPADQSHKREPDWQQQKKRSCHDQPWATAPDHSGWLTARSWRRYMRHAFPATARDDSSMLSAATQGATSPIAASGVMSKCQTTEP